MRTIAAALVAVSVLVGSCGTVQPLTDVAASLTTLPMPSGAEVAPSVSGAAVESCDATASLRPSSEPEPTVDAIRRRGRVVVGMDQSTNPFSFRDPVSGELQGFHVDIAREIVRDLVGDPGQSRFPSGVRNPTAFPRCRTRPSTSSTKATTITCRACRADRVLHGVLRRKPTAAGATRIRRCGGRPTWQANGSAPGWTRHPWPPSPGSRRRRPFSVFRIWTTAWSRFSRVRRTRPAPTMRLLAGMAVQDPNLHIVGPALEAEPYGIGINKSQDDLVRAVNASLERIRRDGTWVVAVPEVAHRARPGADSPGTEVSGLTWIETRERAPSW